MPLVLLASTATGTYAVISNLDLVVAEYVFKSPLEKSDANRLTVPSRQRRVQIDLLMRHRRDAPRRPRMRSYPNWLVTGLLSSAQFCFWDAVRRTRRRLHLKIGSIRSAEAVPRAVSTWALEARPRRPERAMPGAVVQASYAAILWSTTAKTAMTAIRAAAMAAVERVRSNRVTVVPRWVRLASVPYFAVMDWRVPTKRATTATRTVVMAARRSASRKADGFARDPVHRANYRSYAAMGSWTPRNNAMTATRFPRCEWMRPRLRYRSVLR